MKKEQYVKVTEFFRQPGWHSTLMFIMNKFIPVLIANVYFVLCVLALLANPVLLIRFAGVPLGVFVAVTILRKIINRKRPYEVFGFSPVSYDTKVKRGQSFPSRHCASAGVIAMVSMAFIPWLGVVMLVLAVIVALSRVFSGMHYISDVVVGLILGVIVGIIGFYPYIF